MTNAAYSELKAAWHLQRIEDLRVGRTVAPAQIHLIISDLCNQNCHFCAYRSSEGLSSEMYGEDTGKGFTMNPARFIPYEKAIEILDDAADCGVGAIQFTGGGEPTAHPRHLDIFRHAVSRGLRAALVTNGVILRDGALDTLAGGGFEWIRVSLDAGSPESYAKIRQAPPETFHRVLKNIEALARAIERQKAECLLGVGFVVTEENWREVGEAARLTREAGARNIRISAVFSKNGPERFHEFDARVRSSIMRAQIELDCSAFQVIDLYGDRISDLVLGAPEYATCHYQQFTLYIGADLKCYRCCTTSYTRRGLYGDLRERRLSEWLWSQERKDKLSSFDARGCSICQFNGKNRVINYLTGQKPLHAEFV